jgi:hypothetical protein
MKLIWIFCWGAFGGVFGFNYSVEILKWRRLVIYFYGFSK